MASWKAANQLTSASTLQNWFSQWSVLEKKDRIGLIAVKLLLKWPQRYKKRYAWPPTCLLLALAFSSLLFLCHIMH